MESSVTSNIHKRNVSFLSLVEVFWGVGLGFIHTQAVVPAFLDDLQATASFIGAVAAVTMFGVNISQFFSGYIAERIRRRKPLIILLHFLAPLPWLLIFFINYWLITTEADYKVGRMSILLSFTAYSLLIGTLIPLYFAFISSLVTEERRARAFGTIFSCQCVAGALAVFFIGRLTSEWDFPQNYAVLFLLAFTLVILGNLFLFGTRERTDAPKASKHSLKEYLITQMSIPLRNALFRRYLVARIALCANLVMFAFLVKYAKGRFGIGGTDWARLFAFFFLIGQASGNQVFGRLADRLGYRITAVLGNILAVGAVLFALYAPTPNVFLLAELIAGVSLASIWVTHMNIVIAYAPSGLRTHYLGLTAMVSAIPLFTGSTLAGWLMDGYGFSALVTVGVTISSIGVILLAVLVRVPGPKEREEVIPSR